MLSKGRTLRRTVMLGLLALATTGGALVWADGQCAIIAIGTCPGQFCDDLGPRTCSGVLGTCTMTVCETTTCFINPSRETKVFAVRNKYKCIPEGQQTEYDCFGSFDQQGSYVMACCDCP